MADVSIAVVYPDLLGTYGDGGNARVLAQRLRWRGIGADIVTVPLGTALPDSCDIYVLGGGEDGPQSLAADELRREGALVRAAERGAAVLAVCAGLQVIGSAFRGSEGIRDGVGLVDAHTTGALDVRAVGELVVEPATHLGLPRLSGYENHAGITTLGPGVDPFGQVVGGVGNGTTPAFDGFVSGHVIGTYLHGPALARNPELADLVLGWVVGTLPALEAGIDDDAHELRAERFAAVESGSAQTSATAASTARSSSPSGLVRRARNAVRRVR